MNFSLSKKKQAKENPPSPNGLDMNGINSFVAQFFVFYGEKYLGWDCFDSRTVRVGKSSSADLVLNDSRIADVQAEFTIEDNSIIVRDFGGNGLLTVNAQPVSSHTLGSFDVVKIGKYSVKIKLKPIESASVKGRPEPVAQKPVNQQTPITAKPVAPAKAKPVSRPVAEKVSFPEEKQKDDLTQSLKDIMDEELESVDLEAILEAEIVEESAQPEPATKSQDRLRAMDEEITESIRLSGLALGKAEKTVKQDIPISPSVLHSLKDEPPVPAEEITWDEFTDEIPLSTEPVKDKPEEKKVRVKEKKVKEQKKDKKVLKARPEDVLPEPHREPEKKNTFPASFFKVIEDEEDDEEEDFPASFSLRDKLIGSERNAGRSPMGEKVLEVIRFRKDSVLDITHLKGNGDHVLVDDGSHYCRMSYNDKQGMHILFNESLLGVINTSQGKEFNAEKKLSAKSLLSREKTYTSMLPVKGELTLSDGFYDYVLRQSFISEGPVVHDPNSVKLPVHKTNGFKYTSWAVMFHVILFICLSFRVSFPKLDEFKPMDTYFVMLETENIHKPIKPKPKPKPPAVKPKKAEKITKKIPKEGIQVSQIRPKKTVKKAEPPKAGGGHDGNVVNRNVNEVGLLATLGMKTGIEITSNDALASVTNMDAITTTHASEAKLKLGGLVADMGDSRINIPTGGVINNKGASDVLRSAGIGGKGNVAALENGNTGNRAVSGSVSAPLTKKAQFKGGGISREAVAKVINDHIDEINYCYESALIGDPTLMGKIIFEWTIMMDGSVGEVKIKSSSVRSNEIHACIKSAIRTWTFPKPKGSAVVVSYPFVFDVSGF